MISLKKVFWNKPVKKLKKLVDEGVIEGFSVEEDNIVIIVRENNISKIQDLLNKYQNIKVMPVKDSISFTGDRRGSI